VIQLDQGLDRFAVNKLAIRALVEDRGFDGRPPGRAHYDGKIYNAICPRSREELKKRQNEPQFVK
jgi:hypothetical protein